MCSPNYLQLKCFHHETFHSWRSSAYLHEEAKQARLRPSSQAVRENCKWLPLVLTGRRLLPQRAAMFAGISHRQCLFSRFNTKAVSHSLTSIPSPFSCPLTIFLFFFFFYSLPHASLTLSSYSIDYFFLHVPFFTFFSSLLGLLQCLMSI